jgi:hypothetical protein
MYDKLGFEVEVLGADTAVAHLKKIEERLLTIRALSSKSSKIIIEDRRKEDLSVKRTTKSFSSYLFKLSAITIVARRLASFVSSAIKETSDYVENLNLFAVAYGDVYQETLDWALNLADGFGLASNEVLKFAGTFRQLSTSLGLVEDTANSVSQTVTQLGYDLSALFNTSVEKAMDKLQSSIFSGNVRPLRAYGIDISQTQIDALFATNEALASMNVNARNLTQSDKVLARLIITLRDGSNAFGTMNREINTLQSQIRILQGSFSNFKLAVGDLIHEPLKEALIYTNAFLIAITDIIRAFAPLKTEDENAFTNIALGAEEASDEIDNLNGKLGDFDKFNVLGGQDKTSSYAITEALTAELEKQQKLYQEQVDAMSKIKNEAVEMSKSIVDWFIKLEGYDEEGNPIYGLTDQVELLSSALMTLISIKVYNWIFNLISSMKLATGEFNLMATASNVLAGAGLFLLISNTIDLIKNWDELDGKGKAIRITMIAVGGALTLFSTLTKIALKDTTLLTTAFKLQKIAAIGLTVGGIGLLVASLTNLIGNWDKLNGFEKVIGIFGAVGAAALAAAAAIAAFQGSWTLGTAIPAIVGGLLAITAAFATFKKDTQDIKGFADGGYSNANLIMTHENGKREWVGKQAGSSAIVNDTQMSDIMEMAVARGVYNALSARGAMNGDSPTNETIVVKIGEEEVFTAVKRTAKRKGLQFANV